jgi:hypothetical protein
MVFDTFLSNLHFLDRFLKKDSNQILWISFQCGRTNTQTDERTVRDIERQAGMIRLILVVCSFSNAPQKCKVFCFSKQENTKQTDVSIWSYKSDNILSCSMLAMPCIILWNIYIYLPDTFSIIPLFFHTQLQPDMLLQLAVGCKQHSV